MLAKFSVKKPFTVLVGVILIIVFGCVAYTKMTPDLMPNINLPYVVVMTNYAGASPEEVETDVARPLEKQMATLDHIKNVTSRSFENYSLLIMEFSDSVNMDTISVDIREKIDLIKGAWNDKVGSPTVMKINPNMLPVAIAAVNLKDNSALQTSDFVRDTLQNKLEGIEGVASVTTTGMVSEKIQVTLSQSKINKINKKTSNAILRKFKGPKGKLNQGISGAKSGENKIKAGKNKITQAQDKAAREIESAKLKLQQMREQFAQLRSTITQYNAMKAQNEQIKKQVKQANPGATAVQIEALCMQNPTYARNAATMKATEAALKQAGFKKVPTNKEFQAQLDAIDKSILALNIKQQKINANLSNSMSELAASGSAVQSTVAQLQASLAQIQSSQEAALRSADLTGVLTMDNISTILNAQNFSMPAGYVTDGKQKVMVNIGDKIQDMDELKKMVVLNMNMKGLAPVKLSDVADISYTNDTEETYAKIDGNNGVMLSFSKQSGYATADVADRIGKEFETLSKEYKEQGLAFTMLSDQGQYIHMVVNSVMQNLLLGALLAILILLFFLRDIRPTLITACSIPISVIFALALMYFSGVTLNVISLAGLAIGIGMLVDNSIVVIENIYRLRALGYSHTKAAVSGAVQVTGAIVASTLTTICVFAPIVFVEGITRQLFVDMALTITYSLLASLFIALTLVPAMARGLLKEKTRKTVLSPGSRVVALYKKWLQMILSHRKWALIGAVVLLFGSTGFALSQGFAFMPDMASQQMSVSIQMPKDSELQETAQTTDAIAAKVKNLDYVETVGAMLASDTRSTMGFSGGAKDTTNSTLYVILDQSKLKKAKDIAKKIEAMGTDYDCEISAEGSSNATSALGTSGVQLNVFCEDLPTLRSTAISIEAALAKVKGLEDITDTKEDSEAEMKVTVKKNKAMAKGLTVAQIFAELSKQLASDKTSTTLVRSEESTDVVVANKKTDALSKEELQDIKITAKKADGTQKKVKLSDVADITEAQTLSSINHDKQKRTVAITAAVKDGYNITHATNAVKAAVDKMKLPDTVNVEYAGENESIMDSMQQMMLMLLLGLLMVYLVMVAQFQSLRSPFIVLFTIPLAFTGGMLALLLSGQVVSVVALLGFVMLMGVIVNNGIVLVDCINRFRLEGMSRKEAIIKAGTVRMRPVFMTAITTVLGLFPLALGLGNGAEMMQPVAIVCIGGLIYGTLTTLFIIPVMYSMLSKKHMVALTEDDLTVVHA